MSKFKVPTVPLPQHIHHCWRHLSQSHFMIIAEGFFFLAKLLMSMSSEGYAFHKLQIKAILAISFANTEHRPYFQWFINPTRPRSSMSMSSWAMTLSSNATFPHSWLILWVWPIGCQIKATPTPSGKIIGVTICPTRFHIHFRSKAYASYRLKKRDFLGVRRKTFKVKMNLF